MDTQLTVIQEYIEQCLKDCSNKLVNDEFVGNVFDSIGVVSKELMI